MRAGLQQGGGEKVLAAPPIRRPPPYLSGSSDLPLLRPGVAFSAVNTLGMFLFSICNQLFFYFPHPNP